MQNALSEVYNASDFVFAVPMALRERLETHPLIGFMVDVVPVRESVDKSMSYDKQSRAWASAVQNGLANSLPHGMLVREIGGFRPHFEIGFQFLEKTDIFKVEKFGDLESNMFDSSEVMLSHAKNNLTFHMSSTRVILDFYKELFDAEKMKLLGSHVHEVLKAIVGMM